MHCCGVLSQLLSHAAKDLQHHPLPFPSQRRCVWKSEMVHFTGQTDWVLGRPGCFSFISGCIFGGFQTISAFKLADGVRQTSHPKVVSVCHTLRRSWDRLSRTGEEGELPLPGRAVLSCPRCSCPGASEWTPVYTVSPRAAGPPGSSTHYSGSPACRELLNPRDYVS